MVIVRNQVDWGRFWLKCAVAYGPSALLLVGLVISLVRGRTRELRETVAPSGFPAQALGLASLCGVMMLVFAAVADVAQQSEKLRPHLPGDPMPSLALPWLRPPDQGAPGAFDVRDYQGRVLVLDFWASWCAPCRRSMPELDALGKELGERGLVVIGVNREPNARDRALSALEDIGVLFPSALDTRGYGERLGLTSLPTSYVVDRKGVLRHLHLGYTEVAKIRAEVEALLDEN